MRSAVSTVSLEVVGVAPNAAAVFRAATECLALFARARRFASIALDVDFIVES